MIELKHVQKRFEDSAPLTDVNAVINKGDVISVIGPSGTGKSTLLRCINMLGAPTAGQIIVDGEEITAPGYDLKKVRRKIGMVFQSFNLFGNMTAIENVMAPQMDLLGRDKKQAYETAMRLLERVGMADKYLKYPEELSGGQKQRVAIARTVAMDPEIILFDEPTSALDPTMVGEVQAVIKDLAKSGTTMMIVTHEMKFARQISSRVFYMDRGELYEEGTPEQIFESPRRERTRAFIQRLKVLSVKFTGEDYSFAAYRDRARQFSENNGLSERQSLFLERELLWLEESLLPAYTDSRVPFRLLIECCEDSRRLRSVLYMRKAALDPAWQNRLTLWASDTGAEANIGPVDDVDYELKLTCGIDP